METRSVSAAARNLHRTQPAISAALKTLESNLGIQLFRREGRRLVPVPEAYYLFHEATEILDRWASAASNFKDMRNRSSGILRVAAMPGTSAYLLPQFISEFISDRPDVKVSMTTRSSPQIFNVIAAQTYDIGFCDVHKDYQQPDLYETRLVEGDCLVAIPNTHPLADRETIHARELDNEPLGTLNVEHSINESILTAFASANARPNVRIRTQFFFPLFHFIEAGQICAVVDPMSAQSYRQMHGERATIHFAKFEPSIPFAYAIVTPKQRPPSLLAQEFLDSWDSFVRTLIKSA